MWKDPTIVFPNQVADDRWSRCSGDNKGAGFTNWQMPSRLDCCFGHCPPHKLRGSKAGTVEQGCRDHLPEDIVIPALGHESNR